MQEEPKECKICKKKTSKSCGLCGAQICYKHRFFCKNCNSHCCNDCIKNDMCPRCKAAPKIVKDMEKSLLYFWPAITALIIYFIGLITSNSTFATFAILIVIVVYPFTFMLEHLRKNQ